ncbi:protein trapped in endoderm-1-like [Daphnia pulex]|uniref:protein trapped in endoderm-1-like n=1 Tax=Daphnia pulex TaxID=6669 RepID=UPI001EE0CFEC|nr:protein trapped in endoderm-1-like [Daphnia pulex]
MEEMSSAAASQWNNMNNNDSLITTADVYNESVTSAHHPIRYPREASYFAAACAILFVFIGIGGNSLTVAALVRSRKLRSHATTAFVLSLAGSDLLFCAFNLPLTASRYIYESWILGDTLCRLFPFFFYGNVAASLFSMVLITINRYILIASPSWYDKIYRRPLIVLMILGSWLFSFLMMTPPLLGIWGDLGLNPATFSCTILPGENGKSPKKFFFAFGFLIPCLTIIVSYTCIFVKVKQSRRNVMAHSPGTSGGNNRAEEHQANVPVMKSVNKKPGKKSTSEKHQRRDDLRLTRMMLIIFCCFLLCFLPLMVVNVADDEKKTKVPVIHVMASILAWASSVINPFIYAFSNRQYRSAYRQLLCGSSRSARLTSQTQTSRSSGRTFLTDMLHYTAHAEKVKVIRSTTNTTTNNANHKEDGDQQLARA